MNAIEPDDETENVFSEGNTGDSSDAHLKTGKGFQDETGQTSHTHREYPSPAQLDTIQNPDCVFSPVQPAMHSGMDRIAVAGPSPISASHLMSRSPISPREATPISSSYGTFKTNRQKRPRRARSVTFLLSSDTDSVTDKDSLIDQYPALASSPMRGRPLRTGRRYRDKLHRLKDDKEYLLSKEDWDNLCDDNTDQARSQPDRLHWWQVLVVTALCCPPCGLASAAFALGSKLKHAKGEKDTATRMLRHSDFCLRLAVVFGIILWFFLFILLSVYIL